jgi:hypothetical protein
MKKPDPLRRKQVEHILNVLSTKRFNDWYEFGNFDRWIRGELNAPDKETILNQIEEMFSKS